MFIPKLNGPSKNVVLCCLPRSGSTPISEAIGHYLYTHEQKIFGGEFFTSKRTIYEGINNAIYETPSAHSVILKKDQDDLEQRIKTFLLRSDLFIKFFPGMLDVKQEEIILNHAKVIFLVRKNLKENLLSALIAHATGVWYTENGMNLQPASVRAEWIAFALFASRAKRLYELLVRAENPQILVYENCMETGPSEWLRSLGYSAETNWHHLAKRIRQNGFAKETRFVNALEIQSWWDASFLPELEAKITVWSKVSANDQTDFEILG